MSSTQVLPQPVHVELGSTYGALTLFIGAILAALLVKFMAHCADYAEHFRSSYHNPRNRLFGLTNIQAFIYYRTRAGRWTKIYRLIVLFLWWFRTLDALHLAFIAHCVYYYLVIANVAALTEVVWSFRLQIVFNAVFLSHMDVYAFSTNAFATTDAANLVGRDKSKVFRIIPCIIMVLSSGVAGVVIWVVWPTFMAFSVAAFLDILVTSSLWYLLARSRTGYSNTESLITNLIRYTIHSGCLTRCCIVHLGSKGYPQCAVMPNNFIFLSVQFLVSKSDLFQVYVNSYIALLNARYYTQSNADSINAFERREPRSNSSDTGLHDTSHEKFPSFRRSMFAHPEVELMPPDRPLQVVMPRRSILVTVQKEIFIDL
ncbi:hypothetical protein EDB19DRAFT_1834678 [Suillus lakei]|nr:hypothetical protein EDB19DRAFT_1834678 [Suillus lakei]